MYTPKSSKGDPKKVFGGWTILIKIRSNKFYFLKIKENKRLPIIISDLPHQVHKERDLIIF